MNAPKRHHWWPQLNSGYWCDKGGKINVLNRDGTSFRGQPNGLGVVGHLYSKELEDGSKDAAIETWFANEVDGPFWEVLKKITDERFVKRTSFRPNPRSVVEAKDVGFKVRNYVEHIKISALERDCISKYVAALLVRNPSYLKKLENFHRASLRPKNSALDNMHYVYQLYFGMIRRADLMIVRRDVENEFLFSDGGIVAREPWSKKGGIPFDVHFPMTPDNALQVLPVPKQEFPNHIPLVRATKKGISIYNRISLEVAQNQVFGRSPIPENFVKKNWGKSAPKSFGYRYVDGELETKVDWSRYS